MDQIQPNASMPHIVQVYQTPVSDSKIDNPQIIHFTHTSLSGSHPAKITYQQPMSSETLTIPVVSELETQRIVMLCQQTQLQNLQPATMQSQILQTDMPSLQFTSHMLLPQLPMLKQPVLVENQHYFSQFSYLKDDYDKEQSNDKQEIEPVTQNQQSQDTPRPCKKKRSAVPNPSTWAHNVRKMKHQSGEAYISRRGKYVPAKRIKSTKDCLTNCKYKCNSKISDSDRELIFKAFYSLSSNEKKHFLLNTTERNDVKNPKGNGNYRRLYSFKYFFLVRGTRHTVCKNFYLGTLSISQKPVYNVHAGKSEINIPKPDGRGQSTNSIHSLPATFKQHVRDHIMSFKTVDDSPIKQFSKKKQFLLENLSIKQMYNMYSTECNSKNIYSVRESMYRKILKEEFNIHFAKSKSDQLCAKCKEPVKKKSDDK